METSRHERERPDPPLHIVLIDDDADVRELTKLTLEYATGWEVTTAADGEEGRARASELEPDAVLVDMMMPGTDGCEVCRRFRADPRTSQIPLVILTARRDLEEEELESVGADGILYKPINPGELAAGIRDLLADGPS